MEKSPKNCLGVKTAKLLLLTTEEVALLHRHERTGRPLGSSDFADHLEQVLVRRLKPQKPGPKIKDE